MKVAYYEVGKNMVIKEIDGPNSIKELVGESISIISHDKIRGFVYLVNDKMYELPSKLKPNKEIYNGIIIKGNFFVAKNENMQIVGLDNEDIHQLMAADMTVKQIIEMDKLYRELCEENNHLKKVIQEAKETLNNTIANEGTATISKVIKILERMEKEDGR